MKERKVLSIISETIGVKKLDKEINIFDLGVNSLTFSMIIHKINVEFSTNLDIGDFVLCETIGDIYLIVEERTA